MKNDFYKDKVVVITGGSSGIGLAVAKQFALQQAKLVLIARDINKLNDAKSTLEKNNAANVLIIAADVADKIAISLAVNTIIDKLERIDVLINCAGIITCGRFKDQSLEDLEKCLFINYLGAVYTSKAAWQWLKKTNGQLSFVSSVAGYVGLIGYSSYSPSKFAMTGLAESLRMEARDDNINVSIIYPPDTDTPFLQYERANTLPESLALNKNIKLISADKVAAAYIKGLQQNRFEIYCDFDSRLVRFVKNNFSGLFFYITQRIIQKAKKKAG